MDSMAMHVGNETPTTGQQTKSEMEKLHETCTQAGTEHRTNIVVTIGLL